MSTADRIAAIRTRHAAATPGPYDVMRDGRYGTAEVTGRGGHRDDLGMSVVGTVRTSRVEDSVLMTPAWDDIQFLLAQVDRLRATVGLVTSSVTTLATAMHPLDD